MRTVDAPTDSILRLILGIAGTAIILGAMRIAAPIVNLVLPAALCTMLFVPVYAWLQRKGMGRGWALAIVFLVVLLICAAILGLFAVTVVGLADNVQSYGQALSQRLGEIQKQLQARGVDATAVTSGLESGGKQLLAIFADLASNLAGLIANGAYVLLIFG